MSPKFKPPEPPPPPEPRRGKSILPMMFAFAAMSGVALPLGRSRKQWLIKLPDGSVQVYKSGSRKGRAELYSSEERAKAALPSVRKEFPDAFVDRA